MSCSVFVGVPGQRDSTDLNLPLIIGLAALGLLLLLLLLILIPLLVARRRRERKAVDNGTLESSTTTTTMESLNDYANGDFATSSPTPILVNQQSQRAPEPAVAKSSKLSTIRRIFSKGSSSNAGRVAAPLESSLYTDAMTARSSKSLPPLPTSPPNGRVHGSSADTLPGLGPERPRPSGPPHSYVYVPPKLHQQPRGWAPASHNVPVTVKRT